MTPNIRLPNPVRWLTSVKFAIQGLYIPLFLALQMVVVVIFYQYGRDNDEYKKLFAKENGEYLEPFWKLYKSLFAAIGIDDANVLLAGMIALLCLLAFLFFLRATRNIKLNSSYLLIILIIFSYQVSMVTGALRQGLSFFAFAIFLLSRRYAFLWGAILLHWTGVVYTAFSRHTLVIASALAAAVVYTHFDDISYLVRLSDRLGGYLGISHLLSTAAIIGLTTGKLVTFGLLVLNRHHLSKIYASTYLTWMTCASPIIQSLLLIAVPNPVFTDRANMVFDPFVLVGLVLVSRRITSVNVLLLLIIITPKLVSRLFVAVT